MTTFALASEYHRLTSNQQDQVGHIIADDGTWTKDQIQFYITGCKRDIAFDIEAERREGWTSP